MLLGKRTSKSIRVKDRSNKLLFFVYLVIFISACRQSSHPSDQELEKRFLSYEADFNELVRMSNEDSTVIRIAPDFTRLENNWAWPRPDSELGFSKQRWDSYRQLFTKLNLTAGLHRETLNDSTVILLASSAMGMLDSGTSKGYAYAEKELSPVFNNLDQNPVEAERRSRHGIVFKNLKGNWYLYLNW